MSRVQTIRDVDYSGPLAGYDAGLVLCNGHRALATKSSDRVEAKEGEWPMISSILEQMFKLEDVD